MGTVRGTFTIRFNRNGDQIFITRNIVSINDSGVETLGTMYQSVDVTSGDISPKWTGVPANQPILKIGISSAKGFPVFLTGIIWSYRGTNITFANAISSEWQTCSNLDGSFAQRWIQVGSAYYAELRIVKDLASSTVTSNQQINYNITYSSNAAEDTIKGSQDVVLQQAGSSSHYVVIGTKLTELSGDVGTANASTTLTAVAYYGGKTVTIGQNGYTCKWFQDGVEISGKTGDTITVDREKNSDGSNIWIDGASVFTVQLIKDGVVLSSDGQRVNDISDKYQIVETLAAGNYDTCSLSQNAVVGFKLQRNGTDMSVSGNYTVDIYNGMGVKMRTATVAATSTLTLTKDDCLCSPTDASGNALPTYYNDCDIDVSIDI